MRMIVAGNWKMHKDHTEAKALLGAMKEMSIPSQVDVMVAPPFPFLAIAVEELKGTSITVAAQNCHEKDHGAFTGEVSAAMLRSLGVGACIIGHSERRQYFGESDAIVAEKIKTLLQHGLIPIYCCGERKEERIGDRQFEVVAKQIQVALGWADGQALRQVVIAYEPVWAIGTGLTATAQQAQDMHAHIRQLVRTQVGDAADAVRILYGGSCKPDNAEELFANADVDGGLIGGASLDAGQFAALVRSAGSA